MVDFFTKLVVISCAAPLYNSINRWGFVKFAKDNPILLNEIFKSELAIILILPMLLSLQSGLAAHSP